MKIMKGVLEMIIIVEGIDRVGKTTLCHKLSDVTGYPIYKYHGDVSYDKMDSDNETDKMLQLINVLSIARMQGKEINLIFDRFSWSDFAYGVTNRNYNVEHAVANFIKIDKALKDIGANVILVRPTDIERSSREHGSDLSTKNRLFNQCYIIASCIKFECNYDTMDSVVDLFDMNR